MSRRKTGVVGALAWWFVIVIVVVAAEVVEDVIRHAALLLPVAAAAVAGAYLVRRWRRRARPVRPVEAARPAARAAEVGRADAERAELRRRVAKLEDDAARHDQLVEDLEDAAGRPVEAVIATYRALQGKYGPSRGRGRALPPGGAR
jgi:hypothetical protein